MFYEITTCNIDQKCAKNSAIKVNKRNLLFFIVDLVQASYKNGVYVIKGIMKIFMKMQKNVTLFLIFLLFQPATCESFLSKTKEKQWLFVSTSIVFALVIGSRLMKKREIGKLEGEIKSLRQNNVDEQEKINQQIRDLLEKTNVSIQSSTERIFSEVNNFESKYKSDNSIDEKLNITQWFFTNLQTTFNRLKSIQDEITENCKKYSLQRDVVFSSNNKIEKYIKIVEALDQDLTKKKRRFDPEKELWINTVLKKLYKPLKSFENENKFNIYTMQPMSVETKTQQELTKCMEKKQELEKTCSLFFFFNWFCYFFHVPKIQKCYGK
jgi:hypothetical protein